jgi:hypothetical protein
MSNILKRYTPQPHKHTTQRSYIRKWIYTQWILFK